MTYSERVLADLKERYPEQPQFIQAATEVLETIQPALDAHPEFEEAARALELYGVSEPVQSEHGYHVILRMPLDPDAVIDYAQSGEGITARSIAASTKFNETLDARVQNAQIEYAGGFQQPDLASLLIPANGAEG